MTRTTMFIVAGIAVGGLVAYAAYFDYKRRTDAGFRKQLRKERKRIAKNQTPSSGLNDTDSDLKNVLESVRKEEAPNTAEGKEKYFMDQVATGEQLSTKGPSFYTEAAKCFYRALRVYPSPVELIVIYEKTVPPPIFQLIMQLTNLDVKERVEGYYKVFPSQAMNVAVKIIDVPVKGESDAFTRKKILVCTKDVEPGELIYKEDAVVTALDSDLQGKGSHCSHCLRNMDQFTIVRLENDKLQSVYCSEECRDQTRAYSQRSLLIPTSEFSGAQLSADRDNEILGEGQKAFAEYLQQHGRVAPELVMRLIARSVSIDMAKLFPDASSTKIINPVATDGGEYGLNDHTERLRFLEVTPSKDETKLLQELLKTIFGIEQLVTEKKYETYLGMMNYNAFGVCLGVGRDDKPKPSESREDVEMTRTPLGTQKQVGTGLYVVSSYLCHSCNPSACPSFDNGNAKLHLRATRALKAGDELTVAYVDVSQREGESVDESRRRRRADLVQGWRFTCKCERCVVESDGMDEEPARDESKVSQVAKEVDGL